MTSPEAAAAVAPAEPEPKPETPGQRVTFVRRTKKASTKSTFMLHCPDTLKGLAKLCAS